jgi:formate C-acetyltransferase
MSLPQAIIWAISTFAMTERTATLRRQSLDTQPSISPERARLMTEFYQANDGRYSPSVMRA